VFWLIDRFIYPKCVQYVLQNRVYSLWSNGKGVDFMVWNMYAVRENEKLKYGKNQSKTLAHFISDKENKQNVFCCCGKVAMENKEYCFNCFTKDYSQLKQMSKSKLLELKISFINEAKKQYALYGYDNFQKIMIEKISLISDIQEELFISSKGVLK
jgi:hypothetical protein